MQRNRGAAGGVGAAGLVRQVSFLDPGRIHAGPKQDPD